MIGLCNNDCNNIYLNDNICKSDCETINTSHLVVNSICYYNGLPFTSGK